MDEKSCAVCGSVRGHFPCVYLPKEVVCPHLKREQYKDECFVDDCPFYVVWERKMDEEDAATMEAIDRERAELDGDTAEVERIDRARVLRGLLKGGT